MTEKMCYFCQEKEINFDGACQNCCGINYYQRMMILYARRQAEALEQIAIKTG